MKNIKLPEVNWDKVLPRTAIFLVLSLVFALITRSRSILILVQFLDVAVVLCLTGLALLALAKRKQ
jgi:hypothetical protein